MIFTDVRISHIDRTEGEVYLDRPSMGRQASWLVKFTLLRGTEPPSRNEENV